LNVLQWLREHAYPENPHKGTMEAIWSGHVHVLEWIHDVCGHPLRDDYEEMMDCAIGLEDWGTVKWLVSHGCPMDNDCYEDITDEETRVWLREHGFH